MLYNGVLVLWSTSSKWHCAPRSYFTVYCLLFCGSTSHHPQLADGKFLISGYGLISLEAQRLIPFLSLGDKSLLQNATRNTFLSFNLFHCIWLQNANYRIHKAPTTARLLAVSRGTSAHISAYCLLGWVDWNIPTSQEYLLPPEWFEIFRPIVDTGRLVTKHRDFHTHCQNSLSQTCFYTNLIYLAL